MKHAKLHFSQWRLNGLNAPRTITFWNDGQFTRNDQTDKVYPQSPEQFDECIRIYIDNEHAELIDSSKE